MDPINHDQLIKEVLRTFFLDFVDLFLPGMAPYVDRDHIEFLDKEIFTDVSSGDRREADLLIKTKFKGQDACFLIHIEAQSSRQPGFAKRMFLYFAGIFQRLDLPVYPVVICTYDQPRNPEPDHYEVVFPDKRVLRFDFQVIQLNRLNWRDFIRHANPAAVALMARMPIEPKDRPKAKLQFLRLLATLKLNSATMQLIWGFVESYLKLTAEENKQFQQDLKELAPIEQEAVMQLPNTWIEEGIEKGIAQGQETMVVRMLRRRLGRLPDELIARIHQLSVDQMADLGEALLDSSKTAELETWLAGRGVR